MHFEVLVEDISGKKALEILIPKIIDEDSTYTIHSYKGIGRIPKGLVASSDSSKRILLDQLPRLIQGYGKTFSGYPSSYSVSLIIVCDLDQQCFSEFRKNLIECLNKCLNQPDTSFCIEIEESEAWLLGDISAIKKAYKDAKEGILKSYVNDSICNTWEILADSVVAGGSKKLSELGWQRVGREKTMWAENISPYMDIEINQSPSFCYFRDKLRYLCGFVSTGSI
ncbi:MAG: hypothetical protein WA902_18220 [Thermosynechococcaceae cyanobacterium]